MSNVDISAMVPSLTRGDWVASLESILTQDYPLYEVVLVIDTPDFDRKGVNYLQKKYAHLKVIFNERNLGATASRNVAARAASGKVLAVHDDDDFAASSRLSSIMDYLARNDVDLVCSYAYWQFPHSDRKILKRIPLTDEGIKNALETKNVIEHASLAIKADSFWAIGGYNETFRYAHDNELYLRASRRGLKFGCIDAPLVTIVFGEDRITTAKRKTQMLYSLAARLIHIAELEQTDRFASIMAQFAPRFFMPNSVRRLKRKALGRFRHND